MNWYSELWLLWSFYSFFPLLGLTLYRIRYQDSYFALNEKSLKTYKVDYLFRLLLVPAVMYYVLDVCYILIQYQTFSSCNFAFLCHHLVTLAGTKTAFTTVYYPWFFMAPFMWHCLLIVYPYESLLNYPYLIIVLTNAYGMFQKPWKDIKSYRNINLIGFSLIPCLALIWLFDCKNDMQNVV